MINIKVMLINIYVIFVCFFECVFLGWFMVMYVICFCIWLVLYIEWIRMMLKFNNVVSGINVNIVIIN